MMTWNDIIELDSLEKKARALRVKAKTPLLSVDERDAIRNMLTGINRKVLAKCCALLYVFSPMSLIGTNLPKRMCSLLSYMANCNKTSFSRAKSRVLFLYECDRSFRNDVNCITDAIMNCLNGNHYGKTDR